MPLPGPGGVAAAPRRAKRGADSSEDSDVTSEASQGRRLLLAGRRPARLFFGNPPSLGTRRLISLHCSHFVTTLALERR